MSPLACRRLSQCVALTFLTLLGSSMCWSSQPVLLGSAGDETVPPGRVRRQLRFGNEWSSWSGWSACSRTCGGGASVRTRTCITRNPLGGPCPGEPRQYKLCNSKECLPGSVEFRELQCAAFNDRPLMGRATYRWTTFHGGSNRCELSCLAVGHNFYYNFGRVLDGTPCHTEPKGVCVNGQCLEPGCDLILGSAQKEDACMVCGGHNTTCLHHHNVYQSHSQAAGPFGYNEVTMIPAGATHIRVTDNSKNYLALQNGRSQFIINGNWKINVPGEYSVAGTKLVYKRSADLWESFEAPGPTQEDLHIMVLFTDRNSGIEYEYWLPPDQYALYHGGRSQLRQPHHAASFTPWQPPITTTTTPTTTTTTTTTRPPHFVPLGTRPVGHPSNQPQARLERDENQSNLLPRPPRARHCGKCRRVRGRGERQRQYCQKDFVFRAKVMGKQYRGQETRYDVQIIHTYRNRFRLEHREFLWVPDVCDCPLLEEGRQYVLMARRHVNFERTLNRILLEPDSYAHVYHPREDRLLRPLEQQCSNRRSRLPAELKS
ncbi:ADAMTS-like protein 5 [Lepisosteus oculatus]|uniref:ADAMTS-like protein 5 n=1 Tax=Lepisosteus oculatus TaxID=7918 RepID=UPI00073FB6D3|nr:PREDICTED: ADAMTS-like protein 5 [Lepisosteus oculatus]XP_015198728.1 PREDICTED: ADAMTS-like protein 5 [Lepisosteus oculatus]